MLDISKLNIRGFVKIEDDETGEVLVEKNNAIHYGNMSSILASALTGDPRSHISYMAFGNNGTTVNGSQITYKPPRVSVVENLAASLYSSTFVRKLTNEASAVPTPDNHVMVPVDSTQTSSSGFKDIVATATLAIGDGNPTGQDAIDNATDNTSAFVFDEIAMYAAPEDALTGNGTSDLLEISAFVNNSESRMLTHVVFHPVQKSQNRRLKITYTIRVQMAEI